MSIPQAQIGTKNELPVLLKPTQFEGISQRIRSLSSGVTAVSLNEHYMPSGKYSIKMTRTEIAPLAIRR